MTRKILGSVAFAAIILTAAASASAHTHAIEKNGQVIANGQNHPAFGTTPETRGTSCDTNRLLPGYGPAWYGLETAHHGPDAGGSYGTQPGKADGCYTVPGNLSPLDPAADRNPAIK